MSLRLLLGSWLVLSACTGAEDTAPPAPVPEPASTAAPAPSSGNPLLDPSLATETAPAEFKVRFETTKGPFVVAVHRDWSPNGADRFYNLVKVGYYDGNKFFRAIEGFIVQFGINGDGAVNEKWRVSKIPDDPVKQSNGRGKITFATGGANSRSTQLFINYTDNGTKLDGMGFSPFGEVTEGMEAVDALYKGYGEGAPRGAGPRQDLIQFQGNAYLEKDFPKLDGIVKATLVP